MSSVVAAAILSSSAFASPWFLPDPIAWYKRTNDVITKNGLNTQVETLSYALVFALFAYGALRASYYARSSEFGALFGRLLLSAAILLSLTPIRGVLHGTWVSAFKWSSGLFSEVEEDLLENADEVTLLLAPFFAAGTTVNFIGRRVATKGASAVAQTGASTVSGVANRATTYMTGVLFLFFPLFGMYAALVYASGFVVLLSMLLLPLAGALLLLPNGASWLSRWLGMYLGALFTVIFLPDYLRHRGGLRSGAAAGADGNVHAGCFNRVSQRGGCPERTFRLGGVAGSAVAGLAAERARLYPQRAGGYREYLAGLAAQSGGTDRGDAYRRLPLDEPAWVRRRLHRRGGGVGGGGVCAVTPDRWKTQDGTHD